MLIINYNELRVCRVLFSTWLIGIYQLTQRFKKLNHFYFHYNNGLKKRIYIFTTHVK